MIEDEGMFTRWSTSTPPLPGFYLTPVDAVRRWDGSAWSLPRHESESYEGAGALPVPGRDPLAVVGSVPWRWYSSRFFTDGDWGDCPVPPESLKRANAVEAMFADIDPACTPSNSARLLKQGEGIVRRSERQQRAERLVRVIA